VIQPQTEDLARRMDFVRQVHSNVADNIRLADTKAGLIAAGAAALLNVLASRARADLLAAGTSFDAQPVLIAARLAVLLFAVVAGAVALLFAYFALRPRLHGPRSYIAFPELARMSTDEYLERVESESDAGLIRELANDTIALSSIALTKHRMVNRAIKPLVGAGVGVAVVLLLG
jgi:Family of unknown function (DUF5706)